MLKRIDKQKTLIGERCPLAPAEAKEHHNCCFVGLDENGKAQCVMRRRSMPESTFMQEVSGSNKEYSFQLPINVECRLFLNGKSKSAGLVAIL